MQPAGLREKGCESGATCTFFLHLSRLHLHCTALGLLGAKPRQASTHSPGILYRIPVQHISAVCQGPARGWVCSCISPCISCSPALCLLGDFSPPLTGGKWVQIRKGKQNNVLNSMQAILIISHCCYVNSYYRCTKGL